jgi:hypothetical protein
MRKKLEEVWDQMSSTRYSGITILDTNWKSCFESFSKKWFNIKIWLVD